MKAKLKLEDGREFAVDVNEETLKQLEKPVKKTGYERCKDCDVYYLENTIGEIDCLYDNSLHDDYVYKNGNYYSDKTVAEHNARAGRLYRQLRRFAVEHRDKGCFWEKNFTDKYFIMYDYADEKLSVDYNDCFRGFGLTYFDSEKTAQAAIEEFKDELIWYFTEYKDSL